MDTKFLLEQKARCERWLSTPESELPGKLTHDVAGALLERTEDELLKHIRYLPISGRYEYND